MRLWCYYLRPMREHNFESRSILSRVRATLFTPLTGFRSAHRTSAKEGILSVVKLGQLFRTKKNPRCFVLCGLKAYNFTAMTWCPRWILVPSARCAAQSSTVLEKAAASVPFRWAPTVQAKLISVCANGLRRVRPALAVSPTGLGAPSVLWPSSIYIPTDPKFQCQLALCG